MNTIPVKADNHHQATPSLRGEALQEHGQKHNKHSARGEGRGDIYQAVTDALIELMESGAVTNELPWQQVSGLPVNAATGKDYNGINVLALWVAGVKMGVKAPEWATYKQWQGLGRQVARGQKGAQIVFYSLQERVDEKGEDVSIPIIRRATVFNRDQLGPADGAESHEEARSGTITDRAGDGLQALSMEQERVYRSILAGTEAQIEHRGGRAYYEPVTDRIVMPERHLFKGTATQSPLHGYLATLYHECIHWTGAKHRLDRLSAEPSDEDRGFEELVAELGAAFLCGQSGLPNAGRADHAGYIQGWLRLLKDDRKAIFKAASQAQKSVDYLSRLCGLQDDEKGV